MNQIWLLSTGTAAKLSRGQAVTAALCTMAGAQSCLLPEKIIQSLLLLVRLNIKLSETQHVSGSNAAEQGDRPPEGCLRFKGRCTANHCRSAGPQPTTAQHSCAGKKYRIWQETSTDGWWKLLSWCFSTDCHAEDTCRSHPLPMSLANFRRARRRVDFEASNPIMSVKPVCVFTSASLNVMEAFNSFTSPAASALDLNHRKFPRVWGMTLALFKFPRLKGNFPT